MFIKRFEQCEEFIAGDGSVLREFLHPDKEELAIRYSLAHAIVKPKDSTKPHRLRVSEVYYILEGKGVMYIDDSSEDVTIGNTIYIPPNSVQYIQNIGESDLKFLCIVDPAWRIQDEEII